MSRPTDFRRSAADRAPAPPRPDSRPAPAYTADVSAIGGLGDGIVRTEAGEVVLVRGGLPGDRLTVADQRRVGGVRHAQLLEIQIPSPQRVEPECLLFGVCGGCDLQHWELDAQRAWKAALLRRALRLSDAEEVPIITTDPRAHRRRARLHLRQVAGRLQAGMLASRSDVLAGTSPCAVLDPRLEGLRAALGPALQHAVEQGEVHAVVGRQGLLLDLTGKPGARPGMDAEALGAELGAQGVALRIGHHAQRWGLQEVDLPEVDGPLAVRVDGAGFCQASAEANRHIRSEVRTDLQSCSDLKHVQEFFAGSGNLTGLALEQDRTVRAVERDALAVARLRAAAAEAGLGARLEVICGAAETEALPTGAHEAWLLDPGRPGARELAQQAASWQPLDVIYVSCALDTLGRDARVLREAGYRVQRAAAIDAFPWTVHLETVVHFRLQN